MIFSTVSSRRFRAVLVLFIIGIGAAGPRLAAGESLPAPLPEELFSDLKDILRTALAQSPTMISRNIELAQNEGNFIQNRAAMLPTVSASASYNVSGAAVSSNTNVSSTSSGLYYSVSVSQPIFQWGRLKAQTDAARIQLSISQRNYAEAYRTLALSLRSQYLGLMARKLALRNARFTQQQVAASLALEEDKLHNGLSTESQLVLLRLQADEAALATERSAEDLAQAKKYFQRQAGLTEMNEDRIPVEIPPVAYDPAAGKALLQRFLSHDWQDTLTIQINRNWLRISELNYKQAQFRLYPMFSLSGSVAQANSTSASANAVSQTSVLSQYVGVSMSWSLFDGLATKGAQISAKGQIRYYERQLQTITDQLLDAAVAAERQVGFSYRAMNLAQTRTSLSESAVRTMQDDAERGLASKSAVEATVGYLNASQLALLNQRADFLTRWSDFLSTTGNDPVLAGVPVKYQSHAP